MRPAGVAEVGAAEAGGRWAAACASQKGAGVSEELAVAPERELRAEARCEAQGRTERYRVVPGVLRAGTPEGRSAQAETAVAKLMPGESGPAAPERRAPALLRAEEAGARSAVPDGRGRRLRRS